MGVWLFLTPEKPMTIPFLHEIWKNAESLQDTALTYWAFSVQHSNDTLCAVYFAVDR